MDSARTGSWLGLLNPTKDREGEGGKDRGVQDGDAICLVATEG